MKKFSLILKNTATNVTRNLKKHSPEILIGVGAVAAVGATVLACKATLDIQEPLKEAKENIDNIKDNKEKFDSSASYNKEITVAYAQTVGIIVKHYALPAALEAAALATIFTSNNIQRKRNALLTTSLSTVQTMYNKYRENVISKYGEEEDFNLRNGIHLEKRQLEEVDENGKTKKVKKEVAVIDEKNLSDFAIIYSPQTNCNWNESMPCNKHVLDTRINYINDLLRVNGRVTVNQFLRELGFDYEQTKLAGQVWGWAYSPNPEDSHYGNSVCIKYREVYDSEGRVAILIDFDNLELFSDNIWSHGDNTFMKKMLAKFH